MADHIGIRQRELLELLLENKGGLCIDDLAKELNISRNAVQQHITVLELAGYVYAGERNKTAGRPVRRYMLTEAGINSFTKQYAWFARLVLADLLQEMGSEALTDYMRKLGQKVADSYQYRFKNLQTDSQRREELLNIMDEFGFKTSSKPDALDDPNAMKAYNCILHDLAQKYSEVCQFDIAFMTALLGRDVVLTECMTQGKKACCFKLDAGADKVQQSESPVTFVQVS